MTTLTLTAGAAPRDRVELAGLASLVGLVAASQILDRRDADSVDRRSALLV